MTIRLSLRVVVFVVYTLALLACAFGISYAVFGWRNLVFGVLIGVVLVILTGGLIALTYIPRVCPECRKLVSEHRGRCPGCGRTFPPEAASD